MPNISDFLRKQDMQNWSRFLATDAGKRGLEYLRRGFVKSKENTEASLIRNAVGFDGWQSAIDEVEKLGQLPDREENADAVEPLEP